MERSQYLLDANVFIEASRRYYAYDIAPKFWTSLIDLVSSDRICSIERVRSELERGNDELSDWAKENSSAMFESTDRKDVVDCFSKIMIWVQSQTQFTDAAKSEFARVADGWLVAFAKVEGYVIVTHEVLKPEARARVLIPNVCQKFGVKFVNTFDMLRDLQVKFV